MKHRTAVHGSKNALLNSIGVDLNIFGKEDHKISTLKKIIDIGVPVKVDIGPSDSKEEISKILGCEEKSDVYFDENHFLNMKEVIHCMFAYKVSIQYQLIMRLNYLDFVI